MDTFDTALRIMQVISNLLLVIVLCVYIKEIRANREKEEFPDE